MKQSDILISPYYTEKAMNHKDANKIEFIVHRKADKPSIKAAVEARFEVKVEKVWVRIQKDGKHAIIKLAEGSSAEEVGSRVGVMY